jgi:hypothetical protein
MSFLFVFSIVVRKAMTFPQNLKDRNLKSAQQQKTNSGFKNG